MEPRGLAESMSDHAGRFTGLLAEKTMAAPLMPITGSAIE